MSSLTNRLNLLFLKQITTFTKDEIEEFQKYNLKTWQILASGIFFILLPETFHFGNWWFSGFFISFIFLIPIIHLLNRALFVKQFKASIEDIGYEAAKKKGINPLLKGLLNLVLPIAVIPPIAVSIVLFLNDHDAIGLNLIPFDKEEFHQAQKFFKENKCELPKDLEPGLNVLLQPTLVHKKNLSTLVNKDFVLINPTMIQCDSGEHKVHFLPISLR